MRLLGPADITRALPMAKAIEAMRTAFKAHALGQAQAPPRIVLPATQGRGSTLVMPAVIGSGPLPLLTVKAVSVYPENRSRGLPSIHGSVLAIDPDTGVPLAMLDAVSLTAIRTAAVCGLATQLLARNNCAVLAVFGAGSQARTQVQAILEVCQIRVVNICSPSLESARIMADELLSGTESQIKIQAVKSSTEALQNADVVCTATTSSIPVFEDRDLPAGVHINAIGSFHPQDREIPGETVVRARVVVDDREAAQEEAGDLLIPIGQGLIARKHILSDLGSLVLGKSGIRTSDDQITFFKSVGLSVQDVAAVQVVLQEAELLGLGQQMDW